LPQTPLGEHTAPPDSIAGFKRHTSKMTTSKGREEEGGGEGEKMIYSPGDRNPHTATAISLTASYTVHGNSERARNKF